jgi:hypothetical protein
VFAVYFADGYAATGAHMKTQILSAIGETGLQQAASLNAGLAANDRIKYAFSLLQMAIDHARHPKQPPSSLKQERMAAASTIPTSTMSSPPPAWWESPAMSRRRRRSSDVSPMTCA